MTSDSPAAPPSPLETPAGRRSRLARQRDRLAPAFVYRDFVRLWRANLGTMMAFWMQNVAQGWLVAILTESAFILATLAMIRAIPMLVLSPFGGVLADRVSRTKLLITSQLLFTVAGLAIGVLVATGRIEVWHLAISSVMAGTSFAISVPSRNALVSDLVPRRHVGNAIALTSTTMNASRIVGPALAGWLIGVIGIAGTYFVQTGGYLWGMVNVLAVRGGDQHPRTRGSPFAALRDGFKFAFSTRPLAALLLLGLSPSLFSMPMIFILPIFVKQDLKAGSEELGLVLAAQGIGAVIGSVAVVAHAGSRRKGPIVMLSAAAFGVAIIALGLTRSPLAAGIVMAFAGLFSAIYMANNQTMIQLLAPNRLRGRVMSIWMLGWGLTPLGLMPISIVAENFGMPTAMVLGGSLSVAVVLFIMVWGRELWTLDAEAAVDPADH